jgi:hypothetical protein
MQNIEHRWIARVSKAFGWFLVWCLTIVSIVFVSYVCFFCHVLLFRVVPSGFAGDSAVPFRSEPQEQRKTTPIQIRQCFSSRPVKMCQDVSSTVLRRSEHERYHKIRNKWQRMAKAWRVDGRTRAEVTRLQVALRGQQLPTMHWRSMKPMNTNFSDAAPNVDCRHLLCYKLVSAKAKSIESSCDPDWEIWEHKGRWYRKIMEDYGRFMM